MASLDRRKFHQLTAAALSGLATGAALGCRSEPAPPATVQANAAKANPDVHLCRGLNDCKGKGKGGNNECRGQGDCATVKEHSCGSENECKGLGGCGPLAGANECAGKGGCHVPLMDEVWKTVRKRVETEWKDKQLTYGEAPPKKE
jgi:hypothetical protein